jgi:hypothetical protein
MEDMITSKPLISISLLIKVRIINNKSHGFKMETKREPDLLMELTERIWGICLDSKYKSKSLVHSLRSINIDLRANSLETLLLNQGEGYKQAKAIQE